MTPERVLVWGGGGHGKVVADLIRATGAVVAGFADRDEDKLGVEVEPGGSTVVISQAALERALREDAGLPGGATRVALAIGDNDHRLRFASLTGDHRLATLVHPAATVSPSVQVGPGTVVFAGAVVNAAASLGRAVIVNTSAVIEHDCAVGDGVHVAPGAVLTGAVRVGPRTLVGARAVILPGISVEQDALVGAGAVVARDVPARSIVAGVPARVIRLRET